VSPTPRKPAEEHTFIAVRVESYHVSASAGINPNLLGIYAKNIRPEDSVFQSTTQLEMLGVCTDPKERTGHQFQITVYEGTPSRTGLRVKDTHARDKNNELQYQTRQGTHYLVCNLPQGLAVLERRRGDDVWTARVPVEPKLVTQMLILLGQGRPTYLSIHEKKVGRYRWIRNISLQTTDPATE
jgi:hypothetical protein